MGEAIYYYAARDDNRRLCEFATSLGLSIFPILTEKPPIMPTDDPVKGPCCFLSPVPRSKLHPYGSPPGIGDTTDPLIEFMRSYHHAPDALVMGRVYCSDDVRDFVPITKPYFNKIANWIKQEWAMVPDGHQYIGPEAQSLVRSGAKLFQLPPNVKVRQIHVGERRAAD
jgi:hypothetical protein